MNFESTPTNTIETSDDSYVKAVQKQQIEAAILAGGENMPQSKVDTLLSQIALGTKSETTTSSIEVNQAGSDLLSSLTTPDTEEGSDVLAADAARRQLDMNGIYAKQALQEKAIKQDWPQAKYEEELQKL